MEKSLKYKLAWVEEKYIFKNWLICWEGRKED